MNRLTSYLASLKDPLKLIQLLMIGGGVAVAYILLASMGGKPKPWEEDGPAYIVGEMAAFERTFPSQPVPNISLQSEAGPVALNSLGQGEVLVVNLWATWCAPCLEELPALDALQKDLAGQVRIVAAAMEGGDGSAQRAMFERLGIEELTLVQDKRLELMRAYGGDLVLPLTVIYSPRGREVGRLAGAADWNSAEAKRLIRAVAAGEVPR